MSEVEKKYYRLCFSISPMSLFSNMEMKEQGLDEESDDIDWAVTYHAESEEKAIEDCVLDYHIPKIDIYDIYIVKKYMPPDYA